MDDLNVERVNGSVILYQFILYKLLQYSLQYRNTLLEKDLPEVDNETIKPNESEEQSIRYVAGYLLYKLSHSVKNKNTAAENAILQICSLWSVKGFKDEERT